MKTLTWKEVAKIAKELQKEYNLPIFAMTYRNMCSCCADADNLNKEAYLTKDVKEKSWSEIDSYIIFKNSTNAQGEANMSDEFAYVRDYRTPKYSTQYVGYKLSENFTFEQFCECVTKLVDAINKASDVQYSLELPEDEIHTAIIHKIFD